MREQLERLGAPEEIVAASSWDGSPPPARRNGILLEVAAVILLLVGGIVLPVIGWVLGLVLLWASGRWSRGDKLLGTFVVPGGLMTPLGLLILPGGESCGWTTSASDGVTVEAVTTETCTDSSFPLIIGIPLVIFLTVAPLVVAARLLSRARQD